MNNSATRTTSKETPGAERISSRFGKRVSQLTNHSEQQNVTPTGGFGGRLQKSRQITRMNSKLPTIVIPPDRLNIFPFNRKENLLMEENFKKMCKEPKSSHIIRAKLTKGKFF